MYKLKDTIELDEGYFGIDDRREEGEALKREVGSQCKAKVLVMVESEKVDNPKSGQKGRRCGHVKMKVIPCLKSDTLKQAVEGSVNKSAMVVMDNFSSHCGVEEVTGKSERQTIPGKGAPKLLPWVHIAISNAKALMRDMYHGVRLEFLQWYLDEFCYKFNRMHFGDGLFDKLVVASITYNPTFKHRLYESEDNCG